MTTVVRTTTEQGPSYDDLVVRLVKRLPAARRDELLTRSTIDEAVDALQKLAVTTGVQYPTREIMTSREGLKMGVIRYLQEQEYRLLVNGLQTLTALVEYVTDPGQIGEEELKLFVTGWDNPGPDQQVLTQMVSKVIDTVVGDMHDKQIVKILREQRMGGLITSGHRTVLSTIVLGTIVGTYTPEGWHTQE